MSNTAKNQTRTKTPTKKKLRFRWRQRHYFFIHLAYILFVCLLGGIILYGTESNNKKVSVPFIDALFTSVSATTITGLFSVDFSAFSAAGQVITLFLIISGGLTFTTIPALCIRTCRARQRMLHKRKKLRESEQTSSSSSSSDEHTLHSRPSHFAISFESPPPQDPPSQEASHAPSTSIEGTSANTSKAPSLDIEHTTTSEKTTVVHHAPSQSVDNLIQMTNSVSTDSISTHARRSLVEIPPVITARHKYDYHRELPQAEEKSRIERILSTKPPPATDIEFLAHIAVFILVITTVLTIWLVCFIIMGAWLQSQYTSKDLSGVNPWWASIFLTISAFNNAGFTPFVDNLVRFAADPMINFIIAFLLVVGNTMFPSLLRLIVVILYKLPTKYKLVFKYLLEHHHHVTIHLFPALETRVYSVTTFVVQLVGLVVGLSLEFKNPIMTSFDAGSKIMIILFHSISTRTAGFNTVDLGAFSPATLLLYSVMMRIKPQMFCSLDEQAYGITKVERKIDQKMAGGQPNPVIPSIELLSVVSDSKAHSAAEQTSVVLSTSSDHSKPNPLTVLTTPAKSDSNEEKSTPQSENIVKFVQEELLDYGDTSHSQEKAYGRFKHAPAWVREILIFVLSFARKLWKHSKNLLLKNNNWLGVFIFLIAIAEVRGLVEEPDKHSILRIIFEVASAFGNVGLTMGFPGLVVSYAGAVSSFSRFCLICVMVLGRHRGLYGAMKDQETYDEMPVDHSHTK